MELSGDPEETKLFGEIAFERGYVTTDQLYEALTIQAKLEVVSHPYKFLGEILIDLRHMTEKQVLEVLRLIHSTQI